MIYLLDASGSGKNCDYLWLTQYSTGAYCMSKKSRHFFMVYLLYIDGNVFLDLISDFQNIQQQYQISAVLNAILYETYF